MSLTEFADKVSQVMPLIMKEFSRHQSNELFEGKITPAQFLTLDFLSKHGESMMTEIAHFMQVSTPAITGLVDRLVRSDYALRVYNDKDRRIIRIRLTAKGEALVKKINQQRRQMIMDIFGKISQGEREDYLNILMHIKDILAQ